MTSAVTYALCRLTRSEAAHLMHAPVVAGGWVAVHPDCREAVRDALGEDAVEFLALLPSDWTEATRRPVGAREALRILRKLDNHAALSVVGEEHVPAEFAKRVRQYLGALPAES